MTTARRAPTEVDQAFFHQIDDGTTSVVTSSLNDVQATDNWLDRVRPYLVLAEPTQFGNSAPALNYATFPDGSAVVLRRTWDPRVPGAVSGHALLGPAARLTPQVALAATGWTGWRDEPPVDLALPPLPLTDLFGPEFAAAARARALHQGDLLARALAWLLQSPGTPLGLVGCPADDRIPLLLALHEITATVLYQREWTFATAGDPEPGGVPAAITFFSCPPSRNPAPDRVIVDLGLDQGASPQNEYRANSLVYRFEYGVDPPIPTVAQTGSPVPAPLPVMVPLPVVPARGNLGTGWSTEYVRAVVSARTDLELERALRRLEDEVADIDDRDEVRAALEAANWAKSALHRLVRFDQREETYDRLVRAVFGATDPSRATAAAHADAHRLAEQSRSYELVRALARASQGTELAPALARRWLRENPPSVPDPTAGLGRLGLLLYRWGVDMAPRREKRILVYLVLLVMFTCFVLGHYFSVGGVL